MSWKTHALAVVVVIVGGLLAYHNSFDVPFQFDDSIAIVENEVIRDVDIAATWEFFPERFVVFLSFAINHRLHGFDVFGFHVVNLAIHIANGLLVYALVLALLRCVSTRPASAQQLAAAVAALLFVLHPLQTQAVTYIWQRTTSLVALFCLAAMLCHVRSVLVEPAGTKRRRGWIAVGIACGVLAMHTKQSAFALPFLIFLLELTVLLRAPATMRERLLRCLPWAVLVPIVPLEVWLLGDPAVTHMVEGGELSAYGYFATQVHVLWEYMRLVVVPIRQNLEHDIATRTTLFEVSTLLQLVGILVFVTVAWLARRRAPLVSLAVIFFFLAQATESSFLPLADVMFEHRVYLPMLSVALLVTSWLLRERERQHIALAIVAIALLALGSLTMSRNEVWKSEVSLWEDVTSKSPGKFRAQENLGFAYLAAGDPRRAAESFENALLARPEHPRMLYKLGICYSETGRGDEAERVFLKALRVRPDLALGYLNFGIHLTREGRLQEAESVLARGLQVHPQDALMHRLLMDIRGANPEPRSP